MLTGILLTGGHSTRMGRDKGLLKLGQKPMVLHVLEEMSGIVDEMVVSVGVGRKGDYEPIFAGKARITEDSKDDFGPLEGIRAAVSSSNSDLVAICPCDTPFVRAKIYKLLLEESEDTEGAVPIIRGFPEPLHAIYNRNAVERACTKVVERGGFRVSEMFQSMDLRFVQEKRIREVDRELSSFWNLNSPDDFRKAEMILAESDLEKSSFSLAHTT
ncbi:MAG: molybdenum cofactor guanylyltransferase [Thermoplasmata archaeon]|nr:molybdenum cofactor guanylyltransferase [Thermoplasmata archaeon]TFG67168.1 MAG: molybdenum cofactor guanylyltransferase [Methanomassiliicoccus sp.]